MRPIPVLAADPEIPFCQSIVLHLYRKSVFFWNIPYEIML